MTKEEVMKVVEEIRSGMHDNEMAHIYEDKLYLDVLTAIAGGATNAAELASEALRTQELAFERWHA